MKKDPAPVYTKAAMIDEQLFSLDVKADQLRFFLEQVVAAVNGHSNSINALQNDLLKRFMVEILKIENSLTRISEAISLRDMEFLKTVSSTLDKPLAENSGNGIDDATNRVINKENVNCSGIAWLYKRIRDWEGKLGRIDDELNKRVKAEDMSKKFKKVKKKLRDEAEEKEKRLLKRISDNEKNNNHLMAQLQSNMSEIEKKTLWKIQDCETLLHKRINSDFVESSCKSVYDRVIKEMEKMKEDSFKQINLDIAELKIKVGQNEDNLQEKLKDMRAKMKDLTDTLNAKYVNIERLDITRNALQERIGELQLKLQDLTRKMDNALALEKQIPVIQQLQDSTHDLTHKQEIQQKEIEELKIKFESSDGGGGGHSDIDPHKMCSLEADVKRLRVDYQDHENKLRQIENEMKRKLDHFEQRIISQLTMMKGNSGGGVNKDEVLLMVERDIGLPNSMLRQRIIQLLQQAINTGTNQSLEQTLKGMLQDIAELMRRTDGLMDLEKKIKLKFKQLSSNDTLDFAKRLDEKADKEQLARDMQVMMERYKTLNELINSMKQGMSALEAFSEHIEAMLQTNSQETLSIITGNNRIIHQKCVVCGTKSKFNKSVVEKGSDYGQSKLYRGDAKPTNVYEAADVYEIPPGQVTLIQENQRYMQTTVGNKHPLVSFKDRPPSGMGKATQDLTNQSTFYSPNRNLRPQSASQKRV